jgi:hypothetical protein
MNHPFGALLAIFAFVLTSSAYSQEAPIPTPYACRPLLLHDNKSELNGQALVHVGAARALPGRPIGEFTVVAKDLSCRNGVVVGTISLRASMNEQPIEDLFIQSLSLEVMSQFGRITPTLFVSGRGIWRTRDGKRLGTGRIWLEWFFRRSPFVSTSQPGTAPAGEPLGTVSYLLLGRNGQTISYGTGTIMSFTP